MSEGQERGIRRCLDIVRTSAILDSKSYLEIYFVLAKRTVNLTTVSLYTLVEIILTLP